MKHTDSIRASVIVILCLLCVCVFVNIYSYTEHDWPPQGSAPSREALSGAHTSAEAQRSLFIKINPDTNFYGTHVP